MNNSRGSRKSMFDTEGVERYFKLRMLNNLVWPARRVESADFVASTERHLDVTLARVFRSLLQRFEVSSRSVPNKFGMLHYYDSAPDSNERPLVMIHGIGSSGQCFALLAAMFKNKRRVVMPDLFHFSGFSQANNPVMTINEHADCLIEFIEHFKTGPVDLCGLSMGGWISLRIAASRPDLVTTMTLLNPAGLRFSPYTLRDSLLHLSWSKFHSLYPGLLSAFPYQGLPFISPVLKRSVFRVLKENGVRDFVKTVKHDHFVDEQLSSIKARVLLLWGNEDRFLSAEIPPGLASGIENCEAYYVERCAHILCIEAPVNVFEAMNRLLGLEAQPDNAFARWMLRRYRRFAMHKIKKDVATDPAQAKATLGAP